MKSAEAIDGAVKTPGLSADRRSRLPEETLTKPSPRRSPVLGKEDPSIILLADTVINAVQSANFKAGNAVHCLPFCISIKILGKIIYIFIAHMV